MSWGWVHKSVTYYLNGPFYFEGIFYELFQNGANVNSKKNFGETALHEAAKQGHLQIVQYLVEKGDNRNQLQQLFPTWGTGTPKNIKGFPRFSSF